MNKSISAIAAIFLLTFTHSSFAADKNSEKLDAILESQPDEVIARYPYRHPKETLLFFGINPGMTVVEALPGAGWYSKILLPYLGEEGHLIGVDYPEDMWPRFEWASKEFIEGRRAWPANWPDEIKGWNIPDAAKTSAYTFNTLPKDLTGTVDAALFIRALHNLSRFESEGAYFTSAMQEAHRLLKPGGILGVVQHATSDKNATGATGYLERDSLVKRIEGFGFKLVDESDINTNPKDNPKADDIVWRLPPSLATSKDNEELRNEYLAIGESNRITLKFIKPVKK